jgi:chromosome segregation ATPase
VRLTYDQLREHFHALYQLSSPVVVNRLRAIEAHIASLTADPQQQAADALSSLDHTMREVRNALGEIQPLVPRVRQLVDAEAAKVAAEAQLQTELERHRVAVAQLQAESAAYSNRLKAIGSLVAAVATGLGYLLHELQDRNTTEEHPPAAVAPLPEESAP